MTQEQLLNDGKAVIRGEWLGAKLEIREGDTIDEKTKQTRHWKGQTITHTIFSGNEAKVVTERPPFGTTVSDEDMKKASERFKRGDQLLIELDNYRRGDRKEGGVVIIAAVWNGLHRAQSPAGRV